MAWPAAAERVGRRQLPTGQTMAVVRWLTVARGRGTALAPGRGRAPGSWASPPGAMAVRRLPAVVRNVRQVLDRQFACRWGMRRAVASRALRGPKQARMRVASRWLGEASGAPLGRCPTPERHHRCRQAPPWSAHRAGPAAPEDDTRHERRNGRSRDGHARPWPRRCSPGPWDRRRPASNVRWSQDVPERHGVPAYGRGRRLA